MASWKRALSIFATAIVVGFIGLELNLRLLGGPIEIFNPLNGFHDGDPVLGWRGKQEIKRRFHTPEFDVVVEHDEEGFRRPAVPRPNDPERRLLILGDSLGWGWGVAQGALFSDDLQRALAPRVAVYNRSVNGYSTGQELLLLRRELAKRDYDDVLVIVTRTDIGDNADDKKHRPAFDLVDGRLVTRNQPPPGSLKGPIERFIDDHSYALNFISWQAAAWKRWWQRRDAPRPEPAETEPTREPGPVTPPRVAPEAPNAARAMPGYAVTQRLLLEIAETCRDNGVALHFAYATTCLPMCKDPVEAGLRDLIADVANRTGATFVDLNPPLEALCFRGMDALIPRDGHWSIEGHRTVAEVLLQSDSLGSSGLQTK